MIQNYLNLESSFDALGVPSAIQNYSIYSPAVEAAFDLTIDLGISTVPQVQYLLANQVDILLYQGNLDLACNTAGTKRWTSNLQWKGQAEFTSKELKPWTSVVGGEETAAGKFKEVNIKMVDGDEKRTRFALVTIDRAGHMVCVPRYYPLTPMAADIRCDWQVPLDQPEIALDMLTRWLAGKSFD
jgi:cathepsin A (carboxypeptidase C)